MRAFQMKCARLVFILAIAWYAAPVLAEVDNQYIMKPSTAVQTMERWISSSPALQNWVTAFWSKYSRDKAWSFFYPGQRTWGYADKHSILPGESFNVMLSKEPGNKPLTGKLRVVRISGDNYTRVDQLVFESEMLSVEPQQLRPEVSVVGAAWPYSANIGATRHWKSGFYFINFVATDGHVDEHVATMIVRPAVKRGDILVKFSTNTVEAYNRWGGFSLYASATYDTSSSMVSFDRPTDFFVFNDALFFLPWIETYANAKGLKVDYISDFDLHTDPSILDDYKLFVSQGHDEYWTKEMFDAVEHRIFTKGMNVLFLSANTAYWQVRYVDVNQSPSGQFLGRQLICYKTYNDEFVDPMASRGDGPNSLVPWLTGMFRTAARRPETMLMGVAYQNWFPIVNAASDYTVMNTQMPFFEGTGLNAGDQLRGIVGYEWDNRDPVGDGNRLWIAGKSLNAQIPLESIHVLMESNPLAGDGKQGKAEAVYWESSAGAKVFSSGTAWWNWGYSKPGVATAQFSRLNENLFNYMLR